MHEPTNTPDFEGLKSLTPAQFMALGGTAVVYVRSIKGAALTEMTGNAEFDEDQDFQLVVAADGSPMMIADSEEAVAEWLSDKPLGVVSLH